MTDKRQDEPDLPGLSPNDADREGAGSGAEPCEDAGAGYGNHAMPDADGGPGDSSRDGE